MENDMERLARALYAAPQGRAAAGTAQKLLEQLKTPQGQALISALSAGGGQGLQRAAQAAMRGDEAGARAALAQLLSPPDGAALLQTLAHLRTGRA